MKARNILENYFRKRTNEIETLLKKPARLFTMEDYHRLRVAIKKVRAMMRMLGASGSKYKSKKPLKRVLEIFYKAGKVRELQLENSVVHKHDLQHRLKTYVHALQLNELKEKKEFLVLHDKAKDKMQKSFSKIVPMIRKVRKSALTEYVRKEKKEIASLTKSRELKNSQIHQLRKGLKKLYYNMKSLGLKAQGRFLKNGETLQEMMGEWHDCRVMKKHLTKAVGRHLTGPSETKRMVGIVQNLYERSEELYRKINTAKRKKFV